MMQIHIKSKTRRPNKWPNSCILRLSSVSLMLLVLVGGSAALLKQQQRSDDSQQSANVGAQQSQQSSSHHQSAYQNHQQQQPGSSISSQSAPSTSYSSSVSISSSSPQNSQSSSSSSSASLSQIGASSQGGSSAASQQVGGRGVDQLSAYSNYAGNGASSASNQKQQQQSSMSYGENLASSANAADQSYQAAANSVNMALANSGIFGPSSGSAPSASASSSASYSPAGNSGPNSVQSLNPLHYFYYPSKDSGSATAKASGGAADLMSISASNNYQSAAYPTYADQLNSALSSIGSGPDTAASSQDPSYLPQPNSNSMPSSMGGDAVGQQQAGGSGLYNSQPQPGQQQAPGNGQQSAPSYNGADLSGAYSSNLNQAPGQQQPSVGQQHQPSSNGISFNGPSNNGMGASGHTSGDIFSMGQHFPGASSSHQQVPPMSAYQSNLYSQMGDLSTSNFGNNAGGLSSVASYMPPNQQHQSAGSSQHDLFGSNSAAASLLGGSGPQFNSAASSLSPASVSPPQQAGSGSLFGSASSMFGGQQAPSSQSNAANNLFSNQHYLNSFLSPQSYGQHLTGPLGQLTDPSQPTAAASSPATSVASSGSSKRFGIGSFIMPMLALAGLSLLIPTMSNIGTAVGRKKRSIEDKASSSSRQQQISFESMNGASQMAKETSIGEYMDKIERYYSIYKNAVENDDCLNRLICEFGDAVKDVTGKSAVVTVIEKLVPNWMAGKVHLFKDAALDNKEGKEKCKKYVCHSNKRY